MLPALFRSVLTLSLTLSILVSYGAAEEKPKADERPVVRVGVLGLDSYQGVAYAQLFNNPQAAGDLAGLRVTAAYPIGSADYPDSTALVGRWKTQLAGLYQNPKSKLGIAPPVEMVESIDALLAKSDAVMIMSLDGRLHLEQAKRVLEAGKRLYIGRPLAASRADAVAILKLAEETGTPCFSCSQHRFSPGFSGMRNHPNVGSVIGCDVYGGYDLKHAAADDFIMPLHSIETLYTIMGPGVVSVSCTSTPVAESITAVWSDGRVGTYRGIKRGKVKYSATVFGDVGVSTAGIYGHGVPVDGIVPVKDEYMGYKGLAIEMAKFFKGGKTPVDRTETLEIFDFLQAAADSRASQGTTVKLVDVRNK
jgi:predicted dehydrogenase